MNLLCSVFFFIYFEQKVVQITIYNSHLDVKIRNIITCDHAERVRTYTRCRTIYRPADICHFLINRPISTVAPI